MPTGVFVNSNDGTGDGTGALTARDANNVAGSSQVLSLITANADISPQNWGHRRFVSRPLAARTFAAADGNWTFSFAGLQSNALHNASFKCDVSLWRPGSGVRIGTVVVFLTAAVMTTTAQTAQTATAAWSGTQAILDGDILVFDVSDNFTQGMATAYTSQFAYNGTTEASTTTCASFVTPPAALTLFTAAAARPVQTNVRQAVQRAASRMSVYRRKSGILVPRIWTPDAPLVI